MSWRAVGIGAVAIFVYLSSLPNSFVSDDLQLVVRHPFTHRLADWPRIFTAGHYAGGGGYRPLTTLSFAMNWLIGGQEALGFHIVNVLLHGLIAALVYVLLWRLLHSWGIALAGGLVFAVHPIHTEAVAWVSGRAELLAAALFVGSWLLYERATRRAPVKKRQLSLSLLCFFAAALSKENALILPAALVLGDLCTWRLARDSEPGRAFFYRRLPLYAAYWVMLGAYFVFRAALYRRPLLRATAQIAFTDNPLAHAPLASRLLTAVRIQGEYLWLLIWPKNLCGDYSFNATPVVSHVDAATTVSAIALAALIGLAAYSFARRGRLWVGIGFYFLAMAPVANVATVIGTIKAERLLYLPSIGFCIVCGIAWRWFRDTIDARFARTARMEIAPYAVLLALIAAAGVKTWRRNEIWRTDFTFWTDTARTAPANIKAQMQFGYLALKLNYVGDAIEAFRRAHAIDPDSADAVMDLGVALMQTRRNDEAMKLYRDAVAEHPNRAAFHVDLGLAHARLGHGADAVEELRRAIELEPNHAMYRFNYGLILSQTGQFDAAANEYRSAIALEPDSPEAWNALGAVLLKANRRDEAKVALNKALELRPRYAEALSNLRLANAP